MKVCIYVLCWNEEKMLPFFFRHYKQRFPNASYVFYDNMSTDASRDIILANGGSIVDYDSANEIRDDFYLNIKNNCWKNAPADWVIVCDVDEFIEMKEEDLTNTTATIYRLKGYDMTGVDLSFVDGLYRGVRSPSFDKCLLFNSRKIKEINYDTGCHTCKPEGEIVYNEHNFLLKHMKMVSLDYLKERNLAYRKRLSALNKRNKWGTHYLRGFFKLKIQYYYYLLRSEKLFPDALDNEQLESVCNKKSRDIFLRITIRIYAVLNRIFHRLAKKFAL